MTPKQQLNKDLADKFKTLSTTNTTDQVAKAIADAVDDYIEQKLIELGVL